MAPDRFQEIRTGLGLTQTGLAKILGVDRRTVCRYEGGETPVPGPVEKLMLMLEACPGVRTAIERAGASSSRFASGAH